MSTPATEKQLLDRLARIEGQVRGVARMVEEERPCLDVLTQVHAIQAALDGVSLGVLDRHSRACLPADADGSDELMRAVARMVHR